MELLPKPDTRSERKRRSATALRDGCTRRRSGCLAWRRRSASWLASSSEQIVSAHARESSLAAPTKPLKGSNTKKYILTTAAQKDSIARAHPIAAAVWVVALLAPMVGHDSLGDRSPRRIHHIEPLPRPADVLLQVSRCCQVREKTLHRSVTLFGPTQRKVAKIIFDPVAYCS